VLILNKISTLLLVVAMLPLTSCTADKKFRTEISYLDLCKQYYANNNEKITGKVFIEQVALPEKPGKNQIIINPYNTCLFKATDHTKEGVLETKRKLQFMRNDYSRRNPFSSNGKYFFVYSRGGNWHLYDAKTLKYIKLLPMAGDAEPVWDTRNENKIYYLPPNGGLEIKSIDVETGSIKIEVNFKDRLQWSSAAHIWTRSEGSPSSDRRYWVFNVDDVDFKGLGMFTYDLDEDKVLSQYDYKANHKSRPDNVTMSPSGKYIVASWAKEGTFYFDKAFKVKRKIYMGTQHSDISIDKQGNDTLIWSHYSNVYPKQYTGWVVAYNFTENKYYKLFRIYVDGRTTSMHFSGKNHDKPGWVLVSTYNNNKDDNYWYNNKVFAVELSEGPKIVNLSSTYNKHDSYWSEVHAAVNNDFTKILFNSNWFNSDSDNIDAHIINLPPNFFK